MDPSMLVGGVIHPPSSSYMPGMLPWTPYIMLLLLLLDAVVLPAGSWCAACSLELSEAFGFPALLEGE